MLKISEFAALAQVSVRLLHHYDRIGLLRPARTDESSGYRYYSVDQLPRLNRILALRDLGLSLEQVGAMLRDSVSADEIRAMLERREAELREQIARDQARLAEAEMRLKSIEQEGHLPRYDVVTKRIAPEHAITGTITLQQGQNLISFYEHGRVAVRAAGLRGKVTSVIGIYPRPFVFERPLVQQFVFHPAYTAAPEHAVPLDVEGYGLLEPAMLPGFTLAAATMHDAPYNQLFAARLALLRWAEANGLRPLGMIREVYLRDRAGESPPLVEVQMPLTG